MNRSGSESRHLPVPSDGVRARWRESRLNPPGVTGRTARRPRTVVAAVALAVLLVGMDVLYIVANPVRSTREDPVVTDADVQQGAAIASRVDPGVIEPYAVVLAVLAALLLLAGAVQAWRGDSSGRVLLSLLGAVGTFGGASMLLTGALTPAGFAYAAVMTVACLALVVLPQTFEARHWFSLRDVWLGRP